MLTLILFNIADKKNGAAGTKFLLQQLKLTEKQRSNRLYGRNGLNENIAVMEKWADEKWLSWVAVVIFSEGPVFFLE